MIYCTSKFRQYFSAVNGFAMVGLKKKLGEETPNDNIFGGQ